MQTQPSRLGWTVGSDVLGSETGSTASQHHFGAVALTYPLLSTNYSKDPADSYPFRENL